MSQERMHPEDLRAIIAGMFAQRLSITESFEGADTLLAHQARTAKQEARNSWPKDALNRIEDLIQDCKAQESRADKAELLLSESVRQLGEAEARANEMYNRLVIAESCMNDAALGLGETRNRRIAELEQWQWDNMKKWLGIIGWGSMTPTQPECPTLIDAALQQGVEDAKRVDTLEARVKELEDAIRDHRNVHSKMPCPTRYEYGLWAKVK